VVLWSSPWQLSSAQAPDCVRANWGHICVVASVTSGTCPLTPDSVPMPSPWPVDSGCMDGHRGKRRPSMQPASWRRLPLLATDQPMCASGSLLADAPFFPSPFRDGAPLGHTRCVGSSGMERCAMPLQARCQLASEQRLIARYGPPNHQHMPVIPSSPPPPFWETLLERGSRYFLVPRKSGEMRPILDLCRLNRSVASGRFWILTIRALLRYVRENDWFTSFDLKDTYFQGTRVPVSAVRLRSSPAHLLVVCGGSTGDTHTSKKDNYS